MHKISKGIIFFIVLIISAYSGLYSQTTSLQSYYDQISVFVADKDSQAVNVFLADNFNYSEYAKLESFVLMRSRDALIANELEFALDLCLSVIDNNLDNFEAVALYTSIERTLVKQNAKVKEEQEKAQIEQMKETAVTTREKEKIEKEYKTITNAVSGETVYLDQEFDTFYLPVTWGIDLGLADIALHTEASTFSFRYGLSLAANVFYRSETFYAGMDVFFDSALVSFPTTQNLVFTVKAVPSFSIPKMIKNIYFRVGYAGIFSSSADNTILPQAFSSPVIGLGVRDLTFGVFLFDAEVDYYIGHVFYENVLFSADSAVNFYIPLADLDTIDVGLNLGVKDIFVAASEGIHNQIKFIISVGVWNND